MVNRNLVVKIKTIFKDDRISMFYHGHFDDDFTHKIIDLADLKVGRKTRKRMAFLMSESFQNIIRHGDDELSNAQSSVFGVRGVDPYIHIFSSNTVNDDTKEFLEEKLEVIDSLDKDGLKKYYREVLMSESFNEKGGAGLGLIEMARKSEQPLQKSFSRIEKGVYAFNMQIDLPMDQQEVEEASPVSIDSNRELHRLLNDHKIIFLLKGNINEELLYPMMSILEGNASQAKDSKGYILYHAAVELLQNMYRHGKVINERKEGFFCLGRTDKGYYLCSGNYLKEDSKLAESIEAINALDEKELNEAYREKIKKSVVENNSNAGVGLLDIRRTSSSAIDYSLIQEEKENFVSIGIEIAN